MLDFGGVTPLMVHVILGNFRVCIIRMAGNWETDGVHRKTGPGNPLKIRGHFFIQVGKKFYMISHSSFIEKSGWRFDVSG